MDTPFLYGKTVGEDSFTNRREDIKRLTQNFEQGINTILISPRRWGKSSLVKKSGEHHKKPEYKSNYAGPDGHT